MNQLTLLLLLGLVSVSFSKSLRPSFFSSDDLTRETIDADELPSHLARGRKVFPREGRLSELRRIQKRANILKEHMLRIGVDEDLEFPYIEPAPRFNINPYVPNPRVFNNGPIFHIPIYRGDDDEGLIRHRPIPLLGSLVTSPYVPIRRMDTDERFSFRDDDMGFVRWTPPVRVNIGVRNPYVPVPGMDLLNINDEFINFPPAIIKPYLPRGFYKDESDEAFRRAITPEEIRQLGKRKRSSRGVTRRKPKVVDEAFSVKISPEMLRQWGKGKGPIFPNVPLRKQKESEDARPQVPLVSEKKRGKRNGKKNDHEGDYDLSFKRRFLKKKDLKDHFENILRTKAEGGRVDNIELPIPRGRHVRD